MTQFDARQTQIVRSPRAELRSSETHWRAKPGTFEEKVERLESWFDRVLEHPVAQAACVLIFYAAVVATVAGLFALGKAR